MFILMNNVFRFWFSRPLRWINFEWGKVVEMLHLSVVATNLSTANVSTHPLERIATTAKAVIVQDDLIANMRRGTRRCHEVECFHRGQPFPLTNRQ